MDRMRFIPGPEAKSEIHNCSGHITVTRQVALNFADEFLFNDSNPLLYQLVCACLSENDKLDIWFGLRDPDVSKGESVYPSQEEIGHSWAILTTDGKEKCIWEVGRDTPFVGDAYAARAFNAYREALGTSRGQEVPQPLEIGEQTERPTEFRDKPVMSRALAPSNLFHAAGRMWYFIDLATTSEASEPAVLSRPLRAYDALILASLVTLANGSTPLVFGVRYILQNIGTMPQGYVRAQAENDAKVEIVNDQVLLVM